MKALILAAGKGERLGAGYAGLNKTLLRKDGLTLLEHHIRNLRALPAVSEIILVVNHQADQIRAHCQSLGLEVKFCEQHVLDGVVGAIEAAATAIGSDDFLVLLGDEFYSSPRFGQALTLLRRTDSALVGYIPDADRDLIKQNYSFKYTADCLLTDAVEKPVKPFNTALGTGFVFFRNTVLSELAQVPVDSRFKQRVLTDVFRHLVSTGRQVRVSPVADSYVNVNTAAALERLRNLN